MTPEDRAQAVVAYFPAIPPKIRAEMQDVITRAIKRAIAEQLGKLELEAAYAVKKAHGVGKQGKGRDMGAIYFNTLWEHRFRSLRTGKEMPPDDTLGGRYFLWRDFRVGA